MGAVVIPYAHTEAPWWRRALAWRRPLARAVVFLLCCYVAALLVYLAGRAIALGYHRMVVASKRTVMEAAVEDCRSSGPSSVACDLALLIHHLQERR
jgi:hypothetical protein